MHSKPWPSQSEPNSSGVTSVLGGNGLKTNCRYEFSPVFSNSFFNLFFHSYKMRACVPICERLSPTVLELHQFWMEMDWKLTTGMSFRQFSLIGVTSVLGGNRLKTNCRYEFLPVFSNSFFNLSSYSYEIRIPICERLHLTVLELHQFWVETGWKLTAGMNFHPIF